MKNERLPDRTLPSKVGLGNKKSMTEAETMIFLNKNHMKPLSTWMPGQPLLYVLEEIIRGNDGPFAAMGIPPEARPSIARLNAPTGIDFRNEMGDLSRRVYPLLNEDGERIDYYALDSETGAITCMLLPSFSVRGQYNPYHVRKEGLFEANDDLFPPSGRETKE